MADNVYLARRRMLHLSAASVISFYVQCASILMNTPTADRIAWSDTETRAILEYLVLHKAEVADTGNFKMGAYNAAAATIPNKTRSGAQVKTKYQTVS